MAPDIECRICKHQTFIIGEKYGFQFAECRHCNFIFCPEITADFLKKLYRSGFHGPDDGAPANGWCKIDLLTPVLEKMAFPQKIKALEFGAGQSIIPHQLREQYEMKVITVDLVTPPNPHPDHITGDILEIPLTENSFELIYSLQVFEHIPDPLPVISKLYRLLKPGGYLFIHTDMITSEREQSFFDWGYVIPPDHCSYYWPDTFDFLIPEKKLLVKNNKYIMAQKG